MEATNHFLTDTKFMHKIELIAVWLTGTNM